MQNLRNLGEDREGGSNAIGLLRAPRGLASLDGHCPRWRYPLPSFCVKQLLSILLLLASLSCAARAQSTAPASLFDPARHMRVSEVKTGMKGYGLGVFQGTQIERFDVEVISVLRNFNPRADAVLIRCKGSNLEHTGPVAGMSGSPIYLYDEQGRARLIGAFAFGWSLIKDPIAGVQPIEYMLDIGSTGMINPPATRSNAGAGNPGTINYVYDPLRFSKPGALEQSQQSRLERLTMPLMAAGISRRLAEQFAPLLREHNLVALQSGASAAPAPTTRPVKIEPGSVLAAPLVTGDIALTAIGTCTEVIGDRVFGFGHPFNNEGPIALPMATGQVNAIIPVLSQSFKIGAVTSVQGTLVADESAGVVGRFGQAPRTVPVEIRVIYTDGSLDTTYRFDTVSHARLTPILTAMASASALTGRRDLPRLHTLDYQLDFEFSNGKKIRMNDVSTNVAEAAIMRQLLTVLDFVMENPFQPVALEKLSGTMHITPEARQAEIQSASLSKPRYRPGETLRAFVRCRPYRAAEKIIPVELELSRDLPDGKYQLSINDPTSYIQQEQMQRPFRFTTENVEDVFAVLNEIGAIQTDAMYVRLMRPPDGVAVGRTAMPNLPHSRRQALLESGRSDISILFSGAAKVVPTGMVMSGSAELEFEIESGEHVEPRPPRQRG
jgi:hypothetical protein